MTAGLDSLPGLVCPLVDHGSTRVQVSQPKRLGVAEFSPPSCQPTCWPRVEQVCGRFLSRPQKMMEAQANRAGFEETSPTKTHRPLAQAVTAERRNVLLMELD